MIHHYRLGDAKVCLDPKNMTCNYVNPNDLMHNINDYRCSLTSAKCSAEKIKTLSQFECVLNNCLTKISKKWILTLYERILDPVNAILNDAK